MPKGFVRLAACGLAMAVALTASRAAVVNTRASRFDRLVRPDPAWQAGVVAETPEALPSFDVERQGWDAFRAAAGGAWTVHIDRRSGAPLLVEGSGIRWFAPEGRAPSLSDVEAKALAFVSDHEALFKIAAGELVLVPEGSGPVDKDHWTLLFERRVGGIPVEDERLMLHLTRGNLVAFGADRWGAIPVVPKATRDADTARQILLDYMGILPQDGLTWVDPGTLVLSPEPSSPSSDRRYDGPVGAGLSFRLSYRFVLRVAGQPGTWLAKVDATTGEIVALTDSAKYAQAKGGVYPVSDDQQCPDGCEQANYPMPWADISIDGVPQTAGSMGIFDCSPAGGTATTTLSGPYFHVHDNCGAISQSVTCDDDLDLASGTGTDCTVPPGASAGDTHASRTGFYHLNRIGQKGRSWLPSNTWLQSQVTDNVNINATCNAYWNGVSVNFYKSGGGCNNTGEIAGVFLHEWGHGLDNNDGGGYDDPTETYADITAVLSTHVSCVGRGFYQSGNCSGYGDACLNCTGIRDQDWDKHASHTPATPANFAANNCGGGDSPCGKEQHCETYIGAEAVYDLAARDLPAAGVDSTTAWQLTEKLWYKSRQGSGGNAYNCSLPNSDGCGSNSWFTKMRTIDDDDGNLANGTPHAAAIFAAFNRHAIACGASGDASNQNSSSCPTLATPTVTATAGSNSVTLSWTAVTGAANYLILRNDTACGDSSVIVATVPAPTTSYTDTDLPNDFPLYYSVQAQGSNTACESAVSACQSATPQPFAGSIKLGQATYACSSTITIIVRDANIGSSTTTATIYSNTEPTPETVVLTETASGSAKYVGTIPANAGPAVPGDGALSLANGDTITADYVDADDGMGGHNLNRETTATGDCVPPVITQVQATGITDTVATVTWATDESSSTVLHYGQSKPPGQSKTVTGLATGHSVGLSGLQACTVYWYAPESQDPAGNDVEDTNGGQYYHFETLGNLGSGLQSCHAGKVTLAKSTVNCSDTLAVTVTDLDLNLSTTAVDTVQVPITSSTETSPETITLTETGPNTSKFTGSIVLQTGAPAPDGKLEVTSGDIVSATYHDADDGTGVPAISEASATVDCVGAGTTLVEVRSQTDASVDVHWVTTEPTTGRVDWGPTPSLGSSTTAATLATDHTVTLSPLAECGAYYFRIATTDAYGNGSTLDNHGSPYAFNVWDIPPGVFKDEFETNKGWTLAGDWQIAAPQGLGTPPSDPASAFDGTKVLGEDLTGLGAHPGDYEPGVTAKATSPSINATSLSNGQLRFRRKLSTGDGGTATISVLRNGVVFNVWSSTFVSDSDWSLQTVNLSPYADGTSNLQIVFAQTGGASLTHSGWNIDRVVVNSANDPAYQACGGCGSAPSFAGLTSASDANACGDTGITLKWNAAAAWGSGGSGTYAVYRDTVPNFTPSPANLIASGVAGTAYTDASAPNGVTLYYLVRAENNETCSTGPHNGGVVDANTTYLAAQDQTSQPAPGAVGDTLAVQGINDAQVRLTWSAAANAASYHVYRSSQPQGPFSQIANVTALLYEDRDQYDGSTSWYYAVKAADACGNEGP